MAETGGPTVRIPTCDVDPFDRENIRDPYRWHPKLRAAGPLVWMTKYEVWGTGNYTLAKQILNDWDAFCSSAGVGMANFHTEKPWRPPSKLLEADPPEHTPRRAVADNVMSHANLRKLRSEISQQSRLLVDRLLEKREVDGVTDIAQPYILKVFPDAVGLGADGREQLLAYGNMIFNAFGPLNDIFQESIQAAEAVTEYIMRCCTRPELSPGGLGEDAFKAADAGDITEEEALFIVRSMLGAGLDTTIAAIGNALDCFARHPAQWQKLRADPSRAGAAVEEVLRYESPFQCYFRTTTREIELAGQRIPTKQKIMISVGAANRDPDAWEDPDSFDIDRNASRHLAMGFGIHNCLGQVMARLEMQALFTEMANRIERLDVTGPAPRRLNNTLHGFETLPLTLHSA